MTAVCPERDRHVAVGVVPPFWRLAAFDVTRASAREHRIFPAWGCRPLLTGLLLISCAVGRDPVRGGLEAAESEDSRLSVTIRAGRSDVKVGDEVPIEFTITNIGAHPYTYLDRNYDRSGRMQEYQLVAESEAGERVPDPRAGYLGGIGGGLSGEGTLLPGQSFTQTVALNRWALIKRPGRYRITGGYAPGGLYSGTDVQPLGSWPIMIAIEPRSDEEMGAYINALREELSAINTASSGNHGEPGTNTVVMRLMYTADPRIIPVLLDTMYQREPGGGFWETEAFLYYLPRSEATKTALVDVAKRRGLASGMQYVLAQYELTSQEMFPLIERSLAPDTPTTWASGALAAQIYAQDAFTPRLMSIASDPGSAARHQAIYALAMNRTDEAVAALKALLEDADQSIRDATARAIRAAYQSRGFSQGRPLRDADFGEALRRSE